VVGSCECGDEPSGSGATELVTGISEAAYRVTVAPKFDTPDLQHTERLTSRQNMSYVKSYLTHKKFRLCFVYRY
jgi:hypothetical protein